MSDIVTDASIMAALGRQMTMAVQRQMVAAGNLANLDTPGYKAQEVTFTSTLDAQLAGTADGSGAETGAVVAKTRDAEGLPERRDGNNVQMDHELLAVGRASADFSAAQTVLAAKFRLVRYAINEGR